MSTIIIITPKPPPHPTLSGTSVTIPDGMTQAEVAKILRDAAKSLES